MKIHAIQHVAYEGLGFISDWVEENQLTISQTFVYQSPDFPEPDDFDGLIIMGGPMRVYDEAEFPWLKKEKEFIRGAITQGKKVLGICLGAQLIADCLGARVYPNHTQEIGWFPVKKTFLFHSWFTAFDDQEEAMVLHWHNDTFDLPQGAMRLFKSNACENQAFQLDDHVLGIQFHLEMSEQIIADLIRFSGNKLTPKQYVQNSEKIMKCFEVNQEKSKEMLFDLLSCFFLTEE